MTLTDVLNIKTWTPLQSLTGDFVEVLPGVFSVHENIYLLTQPYDAQFERGNPNAPFVTRAYWASSLEALRRAVTADASVTVPLATVPPSEIAFGTEGTYQELAKAIPPEREKTSEKATYNNKGLFLFKHIVIPPFDYHFATPRISPKERTCLIAATLPR